MSKITPPLPIIVEFYYYYSSATLLLCWCIAPFLFYIIFTQSKKLNSIKWLILNHSFWCLALETLLGLVKPLFLSPCAGGVQLGVFKNFGDFRNTAVAALICLSFIANCIAGLTTTISSRYLYVYPSKLTKYLTLKSNIGVMIGTSIFCYLLEILTFYSMFLVDIDTVHEWAREYDPFLENYFHEPSFFLIPHFLLDRVLAAHLTILGLTTTAFIALSIYFLYQILQNQTITTTKFQKSLILSSIMQIYLTNIFLIIPMMAFFIFITFDIPHTATAMCILTSVIMTHCLLEFIATVYFISPYRKFITAYFKKNFISNNNTGAQNASGFLF